MRWPDLSRLGIELRVVAGPPPLLLVRGAEDMSAHGFTRRGDVWTRDMMRFESVDLKRWFPDFVPSDIKDMPRAQVVESAAVLERTPASANPSEKETQWDSDFRLHYVEILEALIARGDIADLYGAAGVRGADAFDDLPMDDRAAAYMAFAERNGAPEVSKEDYNTRVARIEREATVRRLQADQTITQADGTAFKTADAATRFSDEWDLGDTHAVREAEGGYILARLGEAARPSAIRAMQERQAADPEYQRQEAAFARAKELGEAAQAAVDAYENGDIEIEEFEARLNTVKPDEDAAASSEPVVGEVRAEVHERSSGTADVAAFTAGMTPMQRANSIKALEKQFRFDGGVVMTALERVKFLYVRGELKTSSLEEPKIKPMSRLQFFRADQRQQDAHEKKMREAGNKTIYLVNDSEIGKAAYDYAEFLLKRDAALEKVADPIEETTSVPPKAKPRKTAKKKLTEQEEALQEQERQEQQDRYAREQAAARAEQLQLLEARHAELGHIPAAVQPYFALATEDVRRFLSETTEYVRPDGRFWIRELPDPARLYQAIAELDGLPGVKAPRDLGNEYRVAAIWTDAGELSITHYPGRSDAFPEYSIHYSLQQRDTLASYHDRLVSVIECASEEEFEMRKNAGWGLGGDPADKPLPVKAVGLGDHLVTFMGAMWGGHRDDGSRHYSAHGWTLTPLADYPGRTFTRKELGDLWHTEEVGRGDETGMLVTVRGKDYVCHEPIAMVYRQPAPTEKASWDFTETFPMPREIEGVSYLLEETPVGEELSALKEIHAESVSTLVATLLAIDEAKQGLNSGKNPETGRAPKTPHAREELEKKLAHDLATLPDKFEADLDGYEQHFGFAARTQFEAHIRALYADLLATRESSAAAEAVADSQTDAAGPESPAPALAIAERQPTRLGQRVLKILTAAGIRDRLLTVDGVEFSIANPPFAELCIERVPLDDAGEGIALTRYEKDGLTGEARIQSEAVFRISPDGHLIVHETCAYSAEQGIEVRDRDPKFADAFLKDLTQQGFAESEKERKKKISDAGEKIGGARKDLYRSITIESLAEMNDREKVFYVTKDAIWPSIDILEAQKNEVPLALLVMGREVRARVLGSIKRAEFAESYVRVVRGLRAAYEGAQTIRDFVDAIETMAIEVGLIEVAERPHLWQPGKTTTTRGTGHLYQDFQHAGWDYRKLLAIFWNPEILSSKARRFAELYAENEEYDGYAALMARYNRGGGPRTPDENGKLPSRPHLSFIQRSGLPDERMGDVTAEDLMARFGFRGIEFGNWLPQDERQDVLNKAYDAFCTLAHITELPDRMMSLEGTLAIAFGSRGISKAAAHYEPGRTVINLTRMNGAGSTAHEWFHAFDDWMAGVIRKHFGDKGQSLPKEAMFATEFALERTKGRRRRPSRTYPVTRELSWQKDLFPDVAPWFAAVASFVQREQTLEECKAADVAREAQLVLSLRAWLCKGIRANGVSAEDATRHADAALESIDIDELRRMFNRLFANDPDSNYSALNVLQGFGAVQQSLQRIEKLPEDVDLPIVKTNYFANAKLLDSKNPSKPYYSLARELGARAFECYVFDRLVAIEARDDYLVHGVEEARFADGYRGNPYPAGYDRKEINRRMEVALKKVAEKFVSSYTYETTGDLFAPAPRKAACR